ncbi:hexosaminidase D-like [Amphibalanus amphitrite]|uniref:hexosaminidase D-like n=1 Tax=Amphibalanus amphitrite TaxID=1232801 RepID=UPI001C903C1E|nr:hexosaminidase D-like [Amphibalanus amphitrite]XP_043234814.1 hexosaminidase D-like [Amphibalanus amphitrite]
MVLTKLVQPVVGAVLRRWRSLLLLLAALSLLLLLYLQTGLHSPHQLQEARRLPAEQPPPAVPLLYNEDGTRRVHPNDPPAAPLADMLRNSAALAADGPPGAGGEQLPLAGERLPPAEDPVPPEHGPPPEGEMLPDVPLDRARVEELHQERQLQHIGRQPRTPYVPRRRVIHFDLKGAPPTVPYLLKVFAIVKKLGATDVMMEWEDMFPFSGALRPAAAGNHYSRAEVRQIIAEAKRLGLGVIPLVQTFGHLELFLKLEQFSHLRESPPHPEALCPSRNASRRLVETIIDQVMELHAGAAELHVGCDEVYHMGVCDLCQRRLRDELFLEHVAYVARYVRRRYGATPLIWDDMMRHIPADTLRRSGIGELVEPMVWVYAEDVDRFAGPHVYSTFSEVFPRAWTAAAYKGAFGETLILPPLQRHLDNTLNWLATMRRESDRFSDGFAGMVICGWQRYDHMAVLAELLPAGIPSLAIDLATATHGYYNQSLQEPIRNALRCGNSGVGGDSEPFLQLSDDPEGLYQFSQCRFPGVKFFKLLGRYKATIAQTEEFLKTATESKGWLTEYNVERNYSNPFRVDELTEMYYSHKHMLSAMVGSVKSALTGVVDRYTIAEWVEQKLWPYLRRLERLQEQADALKRRSVWPRRPLPMLQALAQYGLNVTETKDRPQKAEGVKAAAGPRAGARPAGLAVEGGRAV